MQATVHEDRPETGPERDLDLLIEKGFLLLGSIEFQIDEHLMSHGTRIDPETRFFMAQVRDAAGDAATKMLDEARTRLDGAPGEGLGEGGGAEAGGDDPAPAPLLPSTGAAVAMADQPGARRVPAFGRMAAHVGLGTAAAALVAALVLAGQAPSGAPARMSGGVVGSEDTAVVAIPAAERAGDAVAADWVGAVTMRAAADLGEHKAKAADGAAKPVTAGPAEAEARAPHPRLWAAFADVARPEAADGRTLAEALAAYAVRPAERGGQPPYPDSRAGPAESGADGSQAAAAAEESLALSRGARREVQRRLALARFDPQHFDGIFGPATRTALGDWQRASGLPATGYLDAAALALLRDRTADAYRSLQAKMGRARQEPTRTVMRSPLPPVSPVRAMRADECRRTPGGKIVYGRGVRCDFRGLRQSIAGLFGLSAAPLGAAGSAALPELRVERHAAVDIERVPVHIVAVVAR